MMGPSAGISRSANSEENAVSGYSPSIADFPGEMREKWGRLLAPVSADHSGRRIETEDGRSVYELQGKANDTEYEIEVTSDGEVIEVEED